MPSTRPTAAFEPISPDLDVHALVESTPNFQFVTRVELEMIEHQGMAKFEQLVLLHVILGGKPLVVGGYEQHLDRWTFALQWLRDNCSQKVENARDLSKKENLPLSIGHYLNNMALLANQWTPQNHKDKERQRIYLKDIDCPPLWHDKLTEVLPSSLFYLNESTGEVDGPGAVDEPNPKGTGTRRGRGIAQAGDLMSSLPPEMRAENMMCYIGHEGTYTPAHREMCASLGQNIMVEASTGAVEDGKITKPGSSIWFMTETKDRHVVSDYWLSALGHDIEVENHFAQIQAWKAAPFKVWVLNQRVGDFVLIPPLAPHQVWNRGTRTMKVAWNRTTVETLEMALDEALPQARMVCRDEQYKNKAIVYYSLVKYSKLLTMAIDLRNRSGRAPAKVRKLQKDFKRLYALFTKILISESFPLGQEEKKVEMVPFDSNITCAYCRGNIFNRFLTCPGCIAELPNGGEDTYDICMDCYSMGRSCRCISKLKWVEQWSWSDLIQKHDSWRKQVIAFEGRVTDESPRSLKAELERFGKRSLAEICQTELRKRPWTDIRKPAVPIDLGNESEKIVVNGDGLVPKKKRKARKSEKFRHDNKVCHFHGAWEPTWKQTECSKCETVFCFGFLARAFDMRPQDILADKAWTCPKCLNFCMCRKCQKLSDWRMVEPPRMMLGHDTKKVADPRSVESLVDYSLSNMSWLQKAGEDGRRDTRRIRKKQRAAEMAKAKQDRPDTDNEDQDMQDSLLFLAHQEGIAIDPSLESARAVADTGPEGTEEEDNYIENPEEGGLYDFYDSLPQSPPRPQHGVPEGVIFDYPDPEIEGTMDSAIEADTPRDTRPGYEPAISRNNSPEIEMTHRKRKRPAVDPGDQAHRSRKASKVTSSYKKKPRKSLVVKLSISREKLGNLNRMTLIAQSALKGINMESELPVISSDLRALNVETGALMPEKKKKAIPAEPREDDDDEEFPGPRARKDRPHLQQSLSVPTRRTRTQNIAYDEGSEVEMPEGAENTESPDTQQTEDENHPSSLESPVEASSPVSEILNPSLFEVAAQPTREIKSFTSINQRLAKDQSDRGSTAKSRVVEVVPPPKLEEPQKTRAKKPAQMSEAEKNRRAKLAALNGIDGDSDSFDDGFSDDDF